MTGPANAKDATEETVSSEAAALELLSKLPPEHPQLKFWHSWAEQQFAGCDWLPPLQQAMTIAYTRMALRNGKLSANPRSYHNEHHINDLLLRITYCAEHAEPILSSAGLAVLSYFAACHDLRQAESSDETAERSLVGMDEQASYQEALRIIDICDSNKLWSEHNKLLLKTMIEGSTFGSGGKFSHNFFQGNLSVHLLQQLQLPNPQDEQLVLLACDLDTANVSLPINQFAESAVRVFDELQAHLNPNISAHQFFSQQQKIYFFEQQKFNSTLTQKLFQPHKDLNEKPLMALSDHIENLPEDTPAAAIKSAFLDKANELAAL